MKSDPLRAESILQAVEAVADRAAPIRVFDLGLVGLNHLREAPSAFGIVGLDLHDIDGLDVLAAVVAERLVERVLVVSGRDNPYTRVCLARLAVPAWLPAPAASREGLARAIRSALLDAGVERVRLPPPGALIERFLSGTEVRVFAAIGTGCDDHAAGCWLGMHPETVHSHRKRIMRKLGVNQRTALVDAAERYGIVRRSPTGVWLRPGFDAWLAAEGRLLPSAPCMLP